MKSKKTPQTVQVSDKSLAVDALLAAILNSLDNDKAIDVAVIDLRGKSSIADHMVVASGSSGRHVGALADHLLRKMREDGFGKMQVEGMGQADWVLIDAADVIVHLFRPEVRSYYNLEKMWSADIE